MQVHYLNSIEISDLFSFFSYREIIYVYEIFKPSYVLRSIIKINYTYRGIGIINNQ